MKKLCAVLVAMLVFSMVMNVFFLINVINIKKKIPTFEAMEYARGYKDSYADFINGGFDADSKEKMLLFTEEQKNAMIELNVQLDLLFKRIGVK